MLNRSIIQKIILSELNSWDFLRRYPIKETCQLIPSLLPYFPDNTKPLILSLERLLNEDQDEATQTALLLCLAQMLPLVSTASQKKLIENIIVKLFTYTEYWLWGSVLHALCEKLILPETLIKRLRRELLPKVRQLTKNNNDDDGYLSSRTLKALVPLLKYYPLSEAEITELLPLLFTMDSQAKAKIKPGVRGSERAYEMIAIELATILTKLAASPSANERQKVKIIEYLKTLSKINDFEVEGGDVREAATLGLALVAKNLNHEAKAEVLKLLEELTIPGKGFKYPPNKEAAIALGELSETATEAENDRIIACLIGAFDAVDTRAATILAALKALTKVALHGTEAQLAKAIDCLMIFLDADYYDLLKSKGGYGYSEANEILASVFACLGEIGAKAPVEYKQEIMLGIKAFLVNALPSLRSSSSYTFSDCDSITTALRALGQTACSEQVNLAKKYAVLTEVLLPIWQLSAAWYSEKMKMRFSAAESVTQVLTSLESLDEDAERIRKKFTEEILSEWRQSKLEVQLHSLRKMLPQLAKIASEEEKIIIINLLQTQFLNFSYCYQNAELISILGEVTATVKDLALQAKVKSWLKAFVSVKQLSQAAVGALLVISPANTLESLNDAFKDVLIAPGQDDQFHRVAVTALAKLSTPVPSQLTKLDSDLLNIDDKISRLANSNYKKCCENFAAALIEMRGHLESMTEERRLAKSQACEQIMQTLCRDTLIFLAVLEQKTPARGEIAAAALVFEAGIRTNLTQKENKTLMEEHKSTWGKIARCAYEILASCTLVLGALIAYTRGGLFKTQTAADAYQLMKKAKSIAELEEAQDLEIRARA